MDDQNTTIKDLKHFVEDFVQERDWSQFHNAKNLSMALAIEAGELMTLVLALLGLGGMRSYEKSKGLTR